MTVLVTPPFVDWHTARYRVIGAPLFCGAGNVILILPRAIRVSFTAATAAGAPP